MSADEMRVVCIEDEPEMIDLVRLILSRKGFEVIGADGGVEGLETVRREKPDLVLLDSDLSVHTTLVAGKIVFGK